jgi:hypothetical protein
MKRLRHFHVNSGSFGVLRTVLVAAVVIAFGVGGFAVARRFDLAIGAAFGLLAPYLARGLLTDDPERTTKVLRVWGFSILGGTMVLGYLRDYAVWLFEPPLGGVYLAVLGGYIACYFWLLSDPQIFVRSSK